MFTSKLRKTKAMLEIEKRYGRPIEELLREMYYVKDMTMVQIGRELGFGGAQPGSTISRWFSILQIPVKVTYSEKEYREMLKRRA